MNNCLNSWDVQSRHIYHPDGKAGALYAGVGDRGGQMYVMVKKNDDTTKKFRMAVTDTELHTDP